MEWTETPESSNLMKFAYDSAAEDLHVVFRNGGAYAYEKVPVAAFEAMKAAESKGKYLAAAIKKQYAYRKLAAASPASNTKAPTHAETQE